MLTRRSLLSVLAATAAGCQRAGEPPPGPRAAPPASSEAAAPPPAPPPPGSAGDAAALAPASPTPAAPTASAAPPGPIAVATRFLDLGAGQAVVLVIPNWITQKVPLLVALHGLGEARKGVEGGAWGWVRDYWLDRAMKRLREPPLTTADFQGFVDRKHLAALNASLVERPFRGLVVACPYTPDLLQEKTLDNAGPFGDFVIDRLLPRARAEAPVDGHAGIDGVSLGGRVALLVGLARVEAFTAVGSLQAALQASEAKELARRATQARQKNPSFPLRLLTSEGDFYRSEIRLFHEALQRQKVAHEHLVVPGPHDYPFNRGPGALEMLLWHDRVLRGEEPG
jgi:hypothetical protein